MDTIEGKDTTIEVTPRRVSIIRDTGILDIEIRTITATDVTYPRLGVLGRFQIMYQGAPNISSRTNPFSNESYAIVAFTRQQEEDFKRLRALIHEYQDALVSSLPQS